MALTKVTNDLQDALAAAQPSITSVGTLTGLTVTGEITANGGIALGDGDKATFGAGDDLQIYHDGSNSWVSDQGTGQLILESGGAGVYIQKGATETMANFVADGAVTLYHDNAPKIATTATGIDVTGNMIADGVGIGTSSPSAKVDIFDSGAGNANSSGLELTNYDYGAGETGQSISIEALVRNDGGGTSPLSKIIFGKDSDYSSAAARDGNIQFYTNQSNTVTEAMRISSAGTVGIGVVPHGTPYASSTQLFVGDTGNVQSFDVSGYESLWLTENSRWDTSGTQHSIISGEASSIRLYQGKTVFQQHGSVSADAAQSSWTTAMTIDNAGLTAITDATASSYNQALTVISNCVSRAGLYINQQNASYGHASYGVIRNDVVRAASSAWNFEVCRSSDDADREFKFRGDGNAYADGTWSGGGADYAEYFEWSDGNPSNEDRRGYSVILESNKIRQALVGETPMGVISGNPSVVGDAAWNMWDGKYLTDDFGTYILEEYTVTEWEAEVIDVEATEDTEATYKTVTKSFESDKIPADEIVPSNVLVLTEDGNGNTFERRTLNPDWNPNTEYVPREDRQEWDTVGLMGKLRIIKGQPVDSRWIKMRDVSDAVEEWLVR